MWYIYWIVGQGRVNLLNVAHGPVRLDNGHRDGQRDKTWGQNIVGHGPMKGDSYVLPLAAGSRLVLTAFET